MRRTVEAVRRSRVAVRAVSPRLAWPDDAEIVRTTIDDTTVVFGQPYWIGGTIRLAHAAYWVVGRKPGGHGPWKDEADKIVWSDPVTRLRCMILRNDEGRLGGYVGLPLGHPLHGVDHRKVASGCRIGIRAALNHSAHGKGGEGFRTSEEARIVGSVFCPTELMPLSFQSPVRLKRDDSWWLGFDGQPISGAATKDENGRVGRSGASGLGRDYVGEDHLYHEVVEFARLLRRWASSAF